MPTSTSAQMNRPASFAPLGSPSLHPSRSITYTSFVQTAALSLPTRLTPTAMIGRQQSSNEAKLLRLYQPARCLFPQHCQEAHTESVTLRVGYSSGGISSYLPTAPHCGKRAFGRQPLRGSDTKRVVQKILPPSRVYPPLVDSSPGATFASS